MITININNLKKKWFRYQTRKRIKNTLILVKTSKGNVIINEKEYKSMIEKYYLKRMFLTLLRNIVKTVKNSQWKNLKEY